MPTLRVLDSTMFYEDTGVTTEATGNEEMPIVFLHGNPTSSHVWRHLMRRVGPGRRIRPLARHEL